MDLLTITKRELTVEDISILREFFSSIGEEFNLYNEYILDVKYRYNVDSPENNIIGRNLMLCNRDGEVADYIEKHLFDAESGDEEIMEANSKRLRNFNDKMEDSTMNNKFIEFYNKING